MHIYTYVCIYIQDMWALGGNGLCLFHTDDDKFMVGNKALKNTDSTYVSTMDWSDEMNILNPTGKILLELGHGSGKNIDVNFIQIYEFSLNMYVFIIYVYLFEKCLYSNV
jgi:hypothetical protein